MTVCNSADLICASKGFVAFLKCITFSILGYLFRKPEFSSQFPFVTDSPERPPFLKMDFRYNYEDLFGLIYIQPLLLGGVLAFIWARKEPYVNWIALIPCSIFIALGVIAGAHARYILDFNSLIYIACSLSLLVALKNKAGIAKILIGFSIVWSLPVGFLLGIQGSLNAFSRLNPEMFSKIHSIFKPFERIFN